MILQANMLVDWYTLGITGTAATVAATFAVWLNSQFKASRESTYSMIREVYDKINIFQTSFESKLDYHEKHDDKRFADLNDNIWALRVRNASKDGIDIGRKKMFKNGTGENGNGS